MTIKWNTLEIQIVSVNYINANGCTATSSISKNITVNQLPSPNIAGLASVCVGSTGATYTTEAEITAYTWTVSADGTITAGAAINT